MWLDTPTPGLAQYLNCHISFLKQDSGNPWSQYHTLPLRDPQISGLHETSVSQKQLSLSRRISLVSPFIKMTLGTSEHQRHS